MKIRFIVEKIEKLKTYESVGKIYFMDDSGNCIFEYDAVSGGWGNGPLETGIYNITSAIKPIDMFKRQDKDAYSLFGVGWFAALTPLFETSRTALGIHPDGNVPGTLGCIGIPFKSLDDNTRCWNLISGALEVRGIIDVEVINQLGRVS